MKGTLLRFRRHGSLEVVGQLFRLDLMNRINGTVWQGKEPESCKVIHFKQMKEISEGQNTDWMFTVEYRPPGFTTQTQDPEQWDTFWWEQWRAKHFDITKEGILLNGKGQPLPDGADPVILSWDMYHTADYNAFDFGERID